MKDAVQSVPTELLSGFQDKRLKRFTWICKEGEKRMLSKALKFQVYTQN
jgi:hypothetical protein